MSEKRIHGCVRNLLWVELLRDPGVDAEFSNDLHIAWSRTKGQSGQDMLDLLIGRLFARRGRSDRGGGRRLRWRRVLLCEGDCSGARRESEQCDGRQRFQDGPRRPHGEYRAGAIVCTHDWVSWRRCRSVDDVSRRTLTYDLGCCVTGFPLHANTATRPFVGQNATPVSV